MTDTDIAKWKFWSRSKERVGDMSLKYLGAIDIVVSKNDDIGVRLAKGGITPIWSINSTIGVWKHFP